MQLCNLTLRHDGSMLNTIPITDAMPAEILILQSIHGSDAVVDIRPTRMARTRQDEEWQRLADKYDKGSSFTAAPGEEAKSVMRSLFPGAVKKLPVSLKEIGMGHLMSPASIAAAEASAASPPVVDPAEGDDVDITPDEEEG